MASTSSVITSGFGAPGDVFLVITDGFGGAAVAADTLRGRIRRRRRYHSVLVEADEPTAALVAKERQMVAQMLLYAELDQLIDETKILKGARDQAAKRQETAINAMLRSIDTRITEIIDDDDMTTFLLQD